MLLKLQSPLGALRRIPRSKYVLPSPSIGVKCLHSHPSYLPQQTVTIPTSSQLNGFRTVQLRYLTSTSTRRNSESKLDSHKNTSKLTSDSPLKSTSSKNSPTPVLQSQAGQNNVFTIPNILTMTRIATTPFIGYFIITHEANYAMALFAYSCITDFVDGYIARRFNMKSVMGSILDPMADKFLMTVSTVSLCVGNVMPLYVAALIVGRDVMLSFWAFAVRYKTMEPPKTLRRFADFRNSNVSVHPNLLGKVNTALQMVYIGGLVLRPGIENLLLAGVGSGVSADGLAVALQGLEWLVASTTLASGLSYLISKNTIKHVKSELPR